MTHEFKNRIFRILEGNYEKDSSGHAFNIFITILILLNVLAVILETVESIKQRFSPFFLIFEYISVAVFTVEYVLRLWSCVSERKYNHPVVGRIRFAITPLALVDLFAILPSFLPMFMACDLRFIRILRLFRFFRIFKLARYSESLKILANVLKQKKEELLVIIFVLFILVTVSSCLMYFAENEAQPKSFSSIPAAMWWCIVTLTTVGYGDIYPVTTTGKILGAIIAVLGIGMFALPTGVLASAFVEELGKKHEREIICPHCGKPIGEKDKKA
ncbi:MAG: ion transporter [Verrucomicrobiae bacterium]|nr:ion transporter [Verrucomicrobiae bacterium]